MTAMARLGALDERVLGALARRLKPVVEPVRALAVRHPVAARRVALAAKVGLAVALALEAVFGDFASATTCALIILLVVLTPTTQRQPRGRSSDL